jgi:hypothetical protein
MKDNRTQRHGLFYCNFCKKSQREVDKLIAGPDVCICNECVEFSLGILAEETSKLENVEKTGTLMLEEENRHCEPLSGLNSSDKTPCRFCHQLFARNECEIYTNGGALCRSCIEVIRAQ